MGHLKLLPGCCCAVAGPWDFYSEGTNATEEGEEYVPPETINTPYIPRMPSIYLAPPYFADSSHPEWFVMIPDSGDGAAFQQKKILTSICPTGVSGSEIVFIYVQDYVTAGDEGVAMLKVDAVAETVDWIVTDQDWIDSTWPVMGSISINLFSAWDVLELATSVTNDISGAGGSCAYVSGLYRWEMDNGGVGITSKQWTIGTTGTHNYTLVSDWLGTEDEDPQSTYYHGGLYNRDDTLLLNFSTSRFPVCQAPQANLALGWYIPSETEYPASSAAYAAGGWTITPKIELYMGPYAINVSDNFPTIDGSVIWDYTAPETGSGPLGSLYSLIRARVDNFDASADTSVIIISYHYVKEWVTTGLSLPSTQSDADVVIGATDLVIGGGATTEIIWEAADASGTPTYDPMFDQRDFYPKWFTPRVLHTTEAAQGGGNRVIVFHRCPFDQSEADTEVDNYPFGFEGNTSLRQLRMVCYKNGVFNHEFISRRGASVQATGTITLSPSGETIFFTATPGGDADGHIYGLDSGAGVSLVVADGPIEKAEYIAAARLLNVTLDITGGNNTVADLREVIDAGGDWITSAPSDDAALIIDGETGSDALDPISGGVGGGSDTVTNYVHDSSDRFYYVANFRMRLRELIGSRWTTTYHENWRISHDGLSVSPVGEGLLRSERSGPGPGHPFGDQSYSSIKNSNLIPICPKKEDI